jgi:predicted XRE-type DNA-binding protein
MTAPRAAARIRARAEIVGAVTRAIRARQHRNPEVSQARAAERLGISRQRMNALINHPGNWTLDTIADLIHAYDLQIAEFRIVLDEELPAENYVHPLSQVARPGRKS